VLVISLCVALKKEENLQVTSDVMVFTEYSKLSRFFNQQNLHSDNLRTTALKATILVDERQYCSILFYKVPYLEISDGITGLKQERKSFGKN